MAFSFSQPIQCRIDELVAGTRAQLIVKTLRGEHGTFSRQKQTRSRRVCGGIPGTADLVTERTAGQPYLAITIDRRLIARHGLNVSDVQHVIEIAIGGKAATALYEENRSFPRHAFGIRSNDRNSVESIGRTLVGTPQGYNVPLNQLAEIAIVEGPAQVSRENGQRRIGVEVNIRTATSAAMCGGAGGDTEDSDASAGVLHHLGWTVREPATCDGPA